MARISVNDLTFGYEGSFDNVFEHVNFSVDTDWKLGLIGRNGKGKTTFLNLLLKKYEYTGNISSSVLFDYFPYKLTDDELEKTAVELFEFWKPGTEDWRVILELSLLDVDTEILYRPIKTLSFGERTKVMLAVLFSGENEFLLIDEPTNHLDASTREVLKEYLNKKRGFILVSHDRDLLDACVDHVLVINRSSIEVMNGNFSTWWENKERKDAFARSENEKHLKEIKKLEDAADRASRWADKNEGTKIGFDPVKEHDRFLNTRAFIGAKTKKMQSRVKSFEERIDREIEEKEGLLNDIEDVVNLKLMPKKHYKERLVNARDFSFSYSESSGPIIENLTFEINQGDRVFITGDNGAGKTSLVKAILANAGYESYLNEEVNFTTSGTLETASNMVISYINQDTSHLKGRLKDYARNNSLDYTLLLAILNQLDMDRKQYEKNMEDFSEGQKKKVLIAASLMTSAHLYIWDEPLNFIDVFSRMQIEKLIESFNPTLILIEHDVRFRENLQGKVIQL